MPNAVKVPVSEASTDLLLAELRKASLPFLAREQERIYLAMLGELKRRGADDSEFRIPDSGGML